MPNEKLPKVERSMLNTLLTGGLGRENLTKVELNKALDYCLSVAQGAQTWGDNVINDVIGGKTEEKPQELDLDEIDYKFETLKGMRIYSDKKRGVYQVFAGDKLTDNEFVLNPTQLPNKQILYSEYPGAATRREIETVLKFYKLIS